MLINADFNWIVELQVDVGDFLRLKSCVLYTETENLEQPRIHVEVIAHVTQPELKSSEVLLWLHSEVGAGYNGLVSLKGMLTVSPSPGFMIYDLSCRMVLDDLLEVMRANSALP